MISISSSLARQRARCMVAATAAATRSSSSFAAFRLFSSSSSSDDGSTTEEMIIERDGPNLPVDVEHYTSGWNVDDIKDYTAPGKYVVHTYNKISPIGLSKLPSQYYNVSAASDAKSNDSLAHAILLRSHKLQVNEIDVPVRAIARCGAGTNNIPVAECTKMGIPVFNTPGANANAVKELILCGMLLGSRRIVDGIFHMKELGKQGLARERVEKDKSLFGGIEIKDKKLAVIGLGHIGASTARDATALGMHVQGYDPGLSVQSALKLPKDIHLCDSIITAVKDADYISINIPYIKGTPEEGGTHGIIGEEVMSHFKPSAVLLNFARGELVDSQALLSVMNKTDDGSSKTAGIKYVSDFPDDIVWDHKNAIILPHLGASTAEAEDEAASMAAETIRLYLEHGTIRNSVNFPSTNLPERNERVIRISIVNKNVPGVLAKITDCIGTKNQLNITQQINQSRGDIAYNVIDIDPAVNNNIKRLSLKELQKELTMLDNVLSTRMLFGSPGVGYTRNMDGKYFA